MAQAHIFLNSWLIIFTTKMTFTGDDFKNRKLWHSCYWTVAIAVELSVPFCTVLGLSPKINRWPILPIKLKLEQLRPFQSQYGCHVLVALKRFGEEFRHYANFSWQHQPLVFYFPPMNRFQVCFLLTKSFLFFISSFSFSCSEAASTIFFPFSTVTIFHRISFIAIDRF